MYDSIPLFPVARRRSRDAIERATRLEVHSSYERERDALVARWRTLCDEMEAIDRRLDELELLIGGW